MADSIIRKIDLHVHTYRNDFLDDQSFTFDLEVLKEYIRANSFNVIAITNHNRFDRLQFETIAKESSKLNCLCLPGIEVSLEEGHILVIGSPTSEHYQALESLNNEAVSHEADDHYRMSLTSFNALVTGKSFLLIPHYYGKSPVISDSTLNGLNEKVYVGEAGSHKKFSLAIKEGELTPVCFSDFRAASGKKSTQLENYEKFTYVKIPGEISFESVKNALKDKKNVSIVKSFLPDTMDILNMKAEASTGINVLIGGRSSGKTHTLEDIYESLGGDANRHILYIKQFAIQTDASDSKTVLEQEANERGRVFCKELQEVISFLDSLKVDEKEDAVISYISSLKGHAESSKADAFSKAPLYQYLPEDVIKPSSETKRIFDSVENLLDAKEGLSEIIEKHITRDALLELRKELLILLKKDDVAKEVTKIADNIAKSVAKALSHESVSVPINYIDYSALLQARYARRKFDNLIHSLKERQLSSENIFGRFSLEVSFGRIETNKTALKSRLGIKTAGAADVLLENSKMDALISVTKNPLSPNIDNDSRWKYFARISCVVKNQHGALLSGGQNAEYSLFKRLKDYQKYEYILIDEIEPSFDNPFLNKEIVSFLKAIGKTSTVFISTHNNNLGVSLCPDQYLYHEVLDTKSGTEYRVYYGSSSAEELMDCDGNAVSLPDTLMRMMEAGDVAYNERKCHYENSED